MAKLVVVGTPIGNLGDLSPRAAKALAEADFIAAEDTRLTLRLLNHLGLKKPLVSYYQHNMLSRGQEILQRILAGESCAIVSDAGMPCISDPGEGLVALCAQAGVEITAVPGPTAVTTALALSGLPTGRFCFEGFLTTNKAGRRQHLRQLAAEERTLVFYEAPHKLLATLADMLATWGNRKISLCRELTKLHEEVLRTTLQQAVEHFTASPPRGEFVLVVAGSTPQAGEQIPLEEAAAMARQLIADGLAPSAAAKQAAAQTGHKKGDIYREVLQDENTRS